METASLVLGILGLCFWWIPLVGIVIPTLATIFGGIKRKTKMGIAGFVMGIIGLSVSVPFAIYMIYRP